MTPFPEPDCDMRAQIGALFDPNHPKTAVFVVPGNESAIPATAPATLLVVSRPEGTLLTTDRRSAALYAERGADDAVMAHILGYPEHKSDVVAACGGNPLRAKAIQALDAHGSVVTEAFTSPSGEAATIEAIRAHVPRGGSLRALTPVEAIVRRLSLPRTILHQEG